ncbi:MAG: type II toxin-antitoxin system VapC family toxin [Candidatus Competibacter sp.]|nr:type II toxin-antitoxin system VapC family toxin [Candidatus Competibacter sp.]
MILLDTNVLSELMRLVPNETVLAWLDRQTGEDVFVSAITEAEILRGIALLPDGKRRAVLAAIADTLFAEDFADRRLPFDSPSAGLYAELAAHRARTGRPISVEDAQIAAIALRHALTLVTRNTRDFADITGLTVVNPWLDE